MNVQHGWITDGQSLYMTNNEGRDWTRISLNENIAAISSLNFVSDTAGWAISQSTSRHPILLKTTDGGQTWTPLALKASSEDTSQAILNSVPQKIAVLPPKTAALSSLQSSIQLQADPTPLAVSSFQMVDATTGWGTSRVDKYMPTLIIRTTDQGKTWKNVTPGDEGSHGLEPRWKRHSSSA